MKEVKKVTDLEKQMKLKDEEIDKLKKQITELENAEPSFSKDPNGGGHNMHGMPDDDDLQHLDHSIIEAKNDNDHEILKEYAEQLKKENEQMKVANEALESSNKKI